MKSLPLIVLFFVVLACNMPQASNAPVKTPSPTPATPSPSPTPEQAMVALVETYTREFSENEVAAGNKYSGKLVQLNGVISDITASTVTFEGTGAILVVCRHSADVSKLKKGQRATVTGRSNGLSMGVYATLTDCSIN